MSLRLRRGTDVERQSVVFAEGELIYTTDAKELYIGDGNTLGGIKITGNVDSSPIALTRDLDLNSFDIVGSGDIDISGAITASVFYGSGAQLTQLPLLNVNNGAPYQIDIVGADSSIIVNSQTSELYGSFFGGFYGPVYDTNNNILVDNVLGSFNGSFNGSFFGDFQGNSKGLFLGSDSSVIINSDTSTITGNFIGNAAGLTNFPADVVIEPGGNYNINIVGDDSSVIINSLNNNINANQIDSTNLQITGNGDTISAIINVNSLNNRSLVRLTHATATDISDSDLLHGSIFFDRDDINGPKTTSLILGGNDGIYFAGKKDGIFPESIYVSVASTGLGVGTFTPTEKLDVRGNAVVTGAFTFGSFDNLLRAELTPVNGMVIYNTTDNRFQGYQNGGWINLDDGTIAL